jgi:hypothetical protein
MAAGKGKESEKRNLKRKAFSYYMQVIDDNTDKVLGYLADISSSGFRLDCRQQIPIKQNYSLRFDLTDEVASKAFMVLVAGSKWCRLDELDPFVYNVGFQIVSIDPEDAEIFKRIVEKYGKGN